MRKLALLPLLALLLLTMACGDTTGPERRSLIGLWTSSGYPQATLTLTLSEVSRTATGTGRRVGADRAEGFRVTGTHAEQSVSLLFEFEGAADDVNFLGEFTDEDIMVGTLVGGGLRNQAITFTRVEEE